MFFLRAALALLFLAFTQHDWQMLDFWHPFRSRRARKMASKILLSTKRDPKTGRRCSPEVLGEPICFRFAAWSVPDLLFIDFWCVLGASSSQLSWFLMLRASIFGAKIATRGPPYRRNLMPEMNRDLPEIVRNHMREYNSHRPRGANKRIKTCDCGFPFSHRGVNWASQRAPEALQISFWEAFWALAGRSGFIFHNFWNSSSFLQFLHVLESVFTCLSWTRHRWQVFFYAAWLTCATYIEIITKYLHLMHWGFTKLHPCSGGGSFIHFKFSK